MWSKLIAWFLKRPRRSDSRPGLFPSAWKPGQPQWTRENATELRRFLTTETGQALMLKARALECAKAIQCQEAASVGNTVIPTFSDAINWFESLAISGETAAQVSHDESPTDGEPALLDEQSP